MNQKHDSTFHKYQDARWFKLLLRNRPSINLGNLFLTRRIYNIDFQGIDRPNFKKHQAFN